MAPKARSSTSSSLLSKSAFTSTKASTSSSLKATLSKSNPVAHKVVVKPNDSSSDSSSTLDVKGYGKLFKVACKEMGDPIHGEGFNPIHVILRVWDCQEEWGPASNISRLERYERAERLGLEPPQEIGEILRTPEGRSKPEYSRPVFSV